MQKNILSEVGYYLNVHGELFKSSFINGACNLETLNDFYYFIHKFTEYKIKQKLFIHLGMHKTGSSSIQESLKNLNIKNYKYINLGISNHSGPLHRLFSHKDVQPNSFLEEDRKSTLALLLSEITNNNQENMLISAEDFVRLSKKELSELKEFFEIFFSEIIIVGYVRPPISFLESAFQQKLKMEKKFIEFDLSSMLPIYKWRFQKMDEVFGKENVLLWKFDVNVFINKSLIEDFCQKLGIPFSGIQPMQINESLSLEAVSILYTYRKAHPQHSLLPDSVLKKISTIGGKKLKFSHDLVRPLLDNMAHDICWMEKRINSSLSQDVNKLQEIILNEKQFEDIAIQSIPELTQLVLKKHLVSDFVMKNTVEHVILLVESLIKTVKNSDSV